MSNTSQDLTGLSEGLLNGYAGNGKIEEVDRGGFLGSRNHFEANGIRYHDEWFVDTHLGGGQELTDVNGNKYTRLYAGGTPQESILQDLGITIKDVSGYLIKKISQVGDKTRLFENYPGEADGDWKYDYMILENEKTIPITIGKEVITYKGVVVHIHVFILCPVR